MGKSYVYWFIGLYISLYLGFFFTELFHRWAFFTRSGSSDTHEGSWHIFIGSIERLFFMLAVAYNASGAILGMIGWITLKTAANQNWIKAKEEADFGTKAMCSLLSSMVSMIFALIGGLFCLTGMG